MNQLLNSTAPVNPVLVNDTRFEDLRKEVRAQGALVKAAGKATGKADDSLPNIAEKIVRASKNGTIDLDAQPDATLILYRDYCEAKDKPSKPGKSEGIQVSKIDAFYWLGRQAAFNGEEAFDLVKRLFADAKKQEREAKEKRKTDKATGSTTIVPGPYESKFIAYLEATRFINGEASANPPRYPRLDANNVDATWQPSELPDSEIVAAMEQAAPASKDAVSVLKKIVDSLEALINGSKKDKEGDPIKDNSQPVVDAFQALSAHVTGLQMRSEALGIIAKAQALGVSMADVQAALHPKPRAGNKRSQRKS